MIDEAAVQALLDKQEIYECLMRYCRGVTRCDEALVRSAYHEDAYDEHGVYRARGWDFAKTIVAAKMAEIRWKTTVIATHLVELDGDRALSEAAFVSFQEKTGQEQTDDVGSDDEHVQVFFGRYVDRFERRNGEWRIALRVIVHDRSASLRLDPYGMEGIPPELFVQGGRQEADLVTGPLGRQMLEADDLEELQAAVQAHHAAQQEAAV